MKFLLQVFDENGNGILEGREFVNFKEDPSFEWEQDESRARWQFGITPIFQVAYDILFCKFKQRSNRVQKMFLPIRHKVLAQN